MLLEMHCHTAEHSTCSNAPAVKLVTQVFRKNLHGIVITDHHFLWPDEDLKALKQAAEVPGYFVVLAGQEVTTSDLGDVLVYGAGRAIPKGTSAVAIRADYPQAALILAHPYRGGKRPDEAALSHAFFDAIEIFNSNHSVSDNARGVLDWHRYKFTAVAGTDTHGTSYAGLYPTHFDHPIEVIHELVDELKRGHCRPLLVEIPRSKAHVRLDEVTFGVEGEKETGETVIIKEFRDPESWGLGRRAFTIMKAVAANGFSGGKYRVPEALEDDNENMTLVEESLKGGSLFEKVIESDRNHAKTFIELAAQWVARLHNGHLRITPPEEFFEKEGERLKKYLKHFKDVDHPHTDRAREIIETVGRIEKTLFENRFETFVQGHGDYHLKNVFIGQDNPGEPEDFYVAAIDFDNSYCLPPAFDVGFFLAQFRNQLLDYPEILQELPEDIFLDAYLAAATRIDSDFLSQVELFRARADLSIASFLIQIGSGESENLWRVLVEAEEALTQFEAFENQRRIR
jgi:hypothetical protein